MFVRPAHLTLALLLLLAAAGGALAQANPSMLVLPGHGYSPLIKLDHLWMQQLHDQGIDLDSRYAEALPPWDDLKNYQVLVLLNLPAYSAENAALLDRYLDAGGGLFLIPDLQGYAGTLTNTLNWEKYLQRWGARIALEHVDDVTTVTVHPRNTRRYIYTDQVLPSPVSEGVKGIWFPGGEQDSWTFHAWGKPIEVSADWTPVVRGGPASFTRPMKMVGVSMEAELLPQMYFRPDPAQPPTLFAVRPVGKGRVALTVQDPIMHLFGGLTWIHDGVLINKGLQNRPSDFGKLFANTVRWLAEPAAAAGTLGGYVQDPLQLKHPNMRRAPSEYFSEFDSYQNPTPPSGVYRGLIGAHTAFSSGQGTVAEWAAAAREAGLDFVVFTEDFARLTEEKYRTLEAQCRELTTPELVLIPGMALKNNIGNPLWVHGFDITWPKPSQLTGEAKDELRLQCFDEQGQLTYSDEDAKNWVWQFHGVTAKNLGYYDFTHNPGVPVRNLRLFGILAVMTYRDGKLLEDLTDEYLDYVTDGAPPLACAMNLVYSPQELRQAVAEGQYLTHVGAASPDKIVEALQYGHQYGRPNVYPSAGPRLRAWAGTQRFSTYAGESFVTTRRRARPELWVTSDAGLREIVIYSETRPYRRLLFNGEKEFHTVFEWAYDRHRELTAIVTDVNGARAVSASRSLWSDTHYNGWCNDRQNGELWHGPLTLPGARPPGGHTSRQSVGPTWDGGPPLQPFGLMEVHPGLATADRQVEGYYRLLGGRLMEGNMYPGCYDDCVSVMGAEAEHVYAPGVVANAYHTLGPIEPSRLLKFTYHRTQFLRRPAGVNLDWHPMYQEEAGASLALIEGVITLRQDLNLDTAHFVAMLPHSYPPDERSVPLMAINTGDGLRALGRVESFDQPDGARGLGPAGERGPIFALQPGGYVGMIPSGAGHTSLIFNVGDKPMRARITKGFNAWWLGDPASGPQAAGTEFPFRYLAFYEDRDEPIVNTLRVENLRRYLGLTGENGCNLDLKRGKLLSQFGLLELAPEDGVVEFAVPNPGWRVNVPLGVRIHGLNPHWTVGQLQIEGYTQGYYTNGKNVYRQLGMDDRDLIHLTLYPDYAPLTHNLVGHPVQCDNPDLIIEVTQLTAAPHQYHVAVNNPTDAPITTTLRRTMALPDFQFPDTRVTVPPGGYQVVLAP